MVLDHHGLIPGRDYSSNLDNIIVVQHSHGWNEDFTHPANLAYLQQQVRYVTIDDGNIANNQTAQLNQNDSGPAFRRVDQALVQRFLTDANYGDDWQVAFSLFRPDRRFDGSDTVALLWALGIGSGVMADWYDFADAYLSDSTRR